ncbi:MAG: alpha/beta fold hydrolase, partial [Pseudomonadota bacterium]
FTRFVLAGLSVSLAMAVLLSGRPRPQPEPRRSRPSSPLLHDDALTAGDGVRLPLVAWEASKPAAIAIGLHGYGDYRRAFRLAGPWFAQHGVSMYAYDQRGFGETESRGEWPGAADLITDLAEAVRLLRERHAGLPLIVVGESMGGAVALAGIGGGEVSGVDHLILAAPAVRGDIPLRELHDLALRLGALAMPWLAVALRRGSSPWLDKGEAARLADDPLILRQISVGSYDGLVELADLASAEPKAEIPPTLLMYGELDATIPRRPIDDLAAQLNGVATKFYPQRHHLLLHEQDAHVVFEDCVQWLDLPAR